MEDVYLSEFKIRFKEVLQEYFKSGNIPVLSCAWQSWSLQGIILK